MPQNSQEVRTCCILMCRRAKGEHQCQEICIDRLTSQNGDRVLLERFATPMPPTKVKSKSNWQTQQHQPQQQQQPKLEDDIQSVWKQRATWDKPSRSARRYETRHGRDSNQGNWCYPLSEAEADTHPTVKEELTETKYKRDRKNQNWFVLFQRSTPQWDILCWT